MTKQFLSSKDVARLDTEEIVRRYNCNAASPTNQGRNMIYAKELENRGVPVPTTNLCGGGSGHVPGAIKD